MKIRTCLSYVTNVVKGLTWWVYNLYIELCQVSVQFTVTSVCDNVHSVYSTVPVDFKCMLEAKLDICVRRNVTMHSANMGVPN